MNEIIIGNLRAVRDQNGEYDIYHAITGKLLTQGKMEATIRLAKWNFKVTGNEPIIDKIKLDLIIIKD